MKIFQPAKSALLEINNQRWHAQPGFLAYASKMTSTITSRGRS